MQNASEQSDSSLGKFTQDRLDALISLHARYLQGRIGGKRAILKNADLCDLSLKDADLSRAEFTNVKMRRMDLTNTYFEGATLYACDLSFFNAQ